MSFFTDASTNLSSSESVWVKAGTNVLYELDSDGDGRDGMYGDSTVIEWDSGFWSIHDTVSGVWVNKLSAVKDISHIRGNSGDVWIMGDEGEMCVSLVSGVGGLSFLFFCCEWIE